MNPPDKLEKSQEFLENIYKEIDKHIKNHTPVIDENDFEVEEISAISQNENEEYFFSLRIPKLRIGVLIGKAGSEKRLIEKITNSRLDINSEEGIVNIFNKDSLILYSTKEVIKAVGRGFNPKVALLLLKDEYINEILNLRDFINKSKKHTLIRIRGRLIGEKGKSRKTIEDLTETNISIYGKTVSIIGKVESVSLAREAVIKLIEGSPHSNVFKFLEKKRRVLREEKMLEKLLLTKEDLKEKKEKKEEEKAKETLDEEESEDNEDFD